MANGIIHIGLPKTGTTSFQNAVYLNRQRLLADFGLYYPSLAPNLTNALCTAFHDDPRKHISVVMSGADTLKKAEALRQKTIKALEKDIERSKWETLVLSAEGLANLNGEEMKGLAEWLRGYVDDWTVLFWSRHPISYAVSSMQEMIKGGATLDTLNVDPPIPYFQGRISNAIYAFGRQRIRLIPFEHAAASPGGVVGEFCRQIGVPDSVALNISATADVANQSMSLLATYIIESLNRLRPLIVDGSRNKHRHKNEQDWISRIEGDRFDLPASAKVKIRSLCRPDVAWLNATFGTDLYSDIFEDGDLTGPADFLPRHTVDTLALMVSDLMERS